MGLPHADRAVVDPAKLQGYLLSTTHPVGRFKSPFFTSLGYRARHWETLAADFRVQAQKGSPDQVVSVGHGTKYVLRDTLTGPSGRTARVVTVWIVLTGEDFPRFVTAYPGDES